MRQKVSFKKLLNGIFIFYNEDNKSNRKRLAKLAFAVEIVFTLSFVALHYYNN